MGGMIALGALLASMEPELVEATFMFVTLPRGQDPPPELSPMMTFREREGVTLILREEEARAAGMVGTFPCRMITLTVHSALDAVGFLAAVTAALAEAGIGVNAVSAFYHDHLFVPVARAEEAMAVLRRTAASAQQAASRP